MQKFFRSLSLSLLISLLASTIAFAGGLSSTFVEEKFRDAEPGKSYSIQEMLHKSFVITNTTEAVTVDIKIEPEKPVDYNLVEGYEPIPDLSWIKINKDYFKDVSPGKSVETDIVIEIPDKKEYRGKKYQVYIYSHTAGKDAFRIGLMGRILIDTAK